MGTGVWPPLKSKDRVTEVVGGAPPSCQTDRGLGGGEVGAEESGTDRLAGRESGESKR